MMMVAALSLALYMCFYDRLHGIGTVFPQRTTLMLTLEVRSTGLDVSEGCVPDVTDDGMRPMSQKMVLMTCRWSSVRLYWRLMVRRDYAWLVHRCRARDLFPLIQVDVEEAMVLHCDEAMVLR